MRFSAFAILVAGVTSGCASGGTTGALPKTVDAGAETAAVAATALRSPLRLVFGWSVQDRDARFAGDGAARLEAPYKARLDLFGPHGVTLLSAAVVDFELRMPPGAPANLLPPPTLMWSVIGVFRAPQGAALVSAQRDSVKSTLQYRAGDEVWTFKLERGQLSHVEWQGPNQGRQTVEIKGYHARGVPSQVVYRDWREFRELTLELNEVHDAQSFPADTWTPGVR